MGILSALGDYVWIDANGNDTGWPSSGLNGVTVQLLNAQGNIIATTTTANGQRQSGSLEFPGLLPNTPYSVQFTAPDGYAFTTQTGNVNDAANSTPTSTPASPPRSR
ncbi:MAG: SdrD B-like domain-containing protein [Caldilineaceae bacterium]